MPRKRTPGSQSKHNKAEQKRAEQLQRQGFKVKADLKKWDQPETIGGVRPDIDARKGQQRVIVEVETPESKNDRRAERQQHAFEGAAKRSAKTRFERIVTDKTSKSAAGSTRSQRVPQQSHKTGKLSRTTARGAVRKPTR